MKRSGLLLALLVVPALAIAQSNAEAFAAADKDMDGKLSEREFIKMFEDAQKSGKGSGPKLSRADLRKKFASVDKNEDKFVSRDEFLPSSAKKGSGPAKKGSGPK